MLNLVNRNRVSVVILLAQLAWLLLVGSTDAGQKVYLRNAVFSEVVSEAWVSREQASFAARFDARLADGFRVDADAKAYKPFLNPKFERELSALRANAATGDRELALAIAERLGDPRNSRICGVESLGKVVFDTDSGQGCCSDFSKAWLFYANYLGLKAREVHNIGHTTVEYWDRQLAKWIWLDPYNKIEITDVNGAPLSQIQIRGMSLFEASNFRRLSGAHSDFSPQAYEPYKPTQYAMVSWRKGVNFLEVEAWDERMRQVGLPKTVRQLVLLTTGVHPGWLVLATDPLAFYLNLLKYMLLGVIAFFVAFDAWLVWRVGRFVAALWRGKRARS